MKILGIDTSGYANAIGVIDGGRVLADSVFEARTDSLQRIVLDIDSVLKSAALTLNDIQGFGVGLGPGSWTGIRVGVTVGKILAYSTGKPVCGVPTLEALAYEARKRPALICPVVSAGTKDTVYAAFYRAKGDTVSRLGDYYVGDINGLPPMVTEPTVFIAAEAQSYRALNARTAERRDISIEVMEAVPRGSVVAILAAARLECGDSEDVLSLTPLYLKESTARAFQNRYSPGSQAEGRQ